METTDLKSETRRIAAMAAVAFAAILMPFISRSQVPASAAGTISQPSAAPSNAAAIPLIAPTVITNYVNITNFVDVPSRDISGARYDRIIRWFSAGTALSAVCAFCTLLYTANTFRNSLKQNRLNSSRDARKILDGMLFDTDKLLIANPKLWAIYDTADQMKKECTGEDKVKRTICLFLYFNMFAAAYNHYHHDKGLISKDQQEYEREFLNAWDSYMEQFFHHSTEARALWSLPTTQHIYSATFRDYVNNIIKKLDGVAYTTADIADIRSLAAGLLEEQSAPAGPPKLVAERLNKLLGGKTTFANDASSKELLVQVLNSLIVSDALDAPPDPQADSTKQTVIKPNEKLDEDRNLKWQSRRKLLETALPKGLWVAKATANSPTASGTNTAPTPKP